MATLTKEQLQTLAGQYVVATKQLQSTFTPTVDDFTKTVCKIGDMVTVYLPIVDKLPELNGNNLPFGEIIEEYMVNDFLPEKYTYVDQAGKKNARRATFAEAVYSYPLEMQKFELGVVRTQFQRVSIGQQSFSDMVACTLSTLDSSYNAWNYASKRQLLGNAATEAAKKTELVSAIAKPIDTATGEAFIKKVKELVEIAKDMNDHNLATHVCGAAPSLKLYVKQGVMPSLEVDTMAGAFNEAKLAVPAEIKTVLDFGTADESIYAILVDERAIKLHDDINKVTTDYTAGDDQDNFYRLLKQTGFISKFAFIHVFKQPA